MKHQLTLNLIYHKLGRVISSRFCQFLELQPLKASYIQCRIPGLRHIFAIAKLCPYMSSQLFAYFSYREMLYDLVQHSIFSNVKRKEKKKHINILFDFFFWLTRSILPLPLLNCFKQQSDKLHVIFSYKYMRSSHK